MLTVEVILTQAYRAMAAGDIDRLMDLYLGDALIQSAGERPIVGTTAIRAFWRTTFDRYHVELVPEVQEVTPFAEVVVVRGRAVGVFAPKGGGAAMPIDGWFMQIYRRQADGSLRFWRGTNGPNPRASSADHLQ
jgi:ketosteroid isomerase-like protein